MVLPDVEVVDVVVVVVVGAAPKRTPNVTANPTRSPRDTAPRTTFDQSGQDAAATGFL